jgi:hypothetical protein
MLDSRDGFAGDERVPAKAQRLEGGDGIRCFWGFASGTLRMAALYFLRYMEGLIPNPPNRWPRGSTNGGEPAICRRRPGCARLQGCNKATTLPSPRPHVISSSPSFTPNKAINDPCSCSYSFVLMFIM